MTDLKQVNEALNTYLRPQTFPLAVRLCKSAEELPERVRIPQRDMGLDISLCHAIALAKRYGWTIAVDKNQTCYTAGITLGFWALPPDVVDGSFQESVGIWGMKKEQAAVSITNMPKFEYGRYQYALIAPVEKATFEPHVILFYGTPAQIWVLLGGYTSGTGSQVNITLSTGAGCTNTITRTIQEEQAKFAIVGTGERLVPNTQDYECAFSVPFTKIEQTMAGLERGYRTGVFRYPIPSFLRYGSQHPPGYAEMRSHILEYMSKEKS